MLTPSDLETRKTGIGASEIASILKDQDGNPFNPYDTPFKIFCRKTGVTQEQQIQNRFIYWGTILEGIVAQEFENKLENQQKYGPFVLEPSPTLRHPDPAYMMCIATPDRIASIDGARKFLLEIKTAGASQAQHWGILGESDEQRMPDQYFLQVQYQLEVAGLPFGCVAVLIGGNDYRDHYYVERDMEIGQMCRHAAQQFWDNHVVPNVPPPVDSSRDCAGWMQRIKPVAGKEIIKGSPEVLGAFEELRDITKSIELLESKKEVCRRKIEGEIGVCYGIACEAGRAVWPIQKGRSTTDWKAIVAEAGISDELVEKHTKIGPETRVLRVTLNDTEGG